MNVYPNAAEARVLAALDADTPTLATVKAAIDALGTTGRLGEINGVDRGSITVDIAIESTDTATIGAVVMARTRSSFSGQNGRFLDATGKLNFPQPRGTLTDTTTVTANLWTTGYNSDPIAGIINYEIMEYKA